MQCLYIPLFPGTLFLMHHKPSYIVQQATRTSKNSIHFVVAFTHLDHAI